MLVRLLFIIKLLLLLLSNKISTQIISSRDFSTSIEKIFLRDDRIFIGTTNFLHQISSLTLNESQLPLILGPVHQNDFHWKILQSIDKETFLICGTSFQGVCSLIDENFNFIVNSSIPVVANDRENSSIGLVLNEKNLIYFGVTFTSDGVFRWQIPSIAGRSLNRTRFMRIVSSVSNDDEFLSKEDLAVRFMPRQQTSFIVQYVFAFETKNFLYFLTRQPNEFETKSLTTKIVRFCRENSNTILRSYAELPLTCVNSDWILSSAEIFNDEILVGLFTRKDRREGSTFCSWKIRHDIDRAFQETYRQCYSMGIGQRGLTFIKPNEICRRDDSWTTNIDDEQFCSAIQTDRLPYPIGGTTPIVGRIFYENLNETTSALKIVSFDEKNKFLLLQGLKNGTLKMALIDNRQTIDWFYSKQITDGQSILSDIFFDFSRSTIFLGGESKIFRLSFADECSSRSSCDQCLSLPSSNVFCGWCSTSERCTSINECQRKFWQKSVDQCSQIVFAQPLNASVDQSQWINLTFSKLPSLEHNEIYQCIFTHVDSSWSSQAIKLDHNRLSCPTPSPTSIDFHPVSQTIVRLSVIKFPSNTTIGTIPEFTFFNCSTYSSCLTCRSQIGCQWCSQRCSSMCLIDSNSDRCSSFSLLNNSSIYIEAEQSAEIPLKIEHFRLNQPIECRLNETSQGLIQSDEICRIAKIPSINSNQNEQNVVLNVYQNDIALGRPISLLIYRCDFYDRCDQCSQRSTCQWCEGRCQNKRRKICSNNEKCSSFHIVDFSPKILSFRGETIVTIYFNENLQENLLDLTLADVPCRIVNISNDVIRCRSTSIDSERRGKIRLRFQNSIFLLSKETIEFRQPIVKTIEPKRIYENGGQILHLNGENLFIGNQQKVFIGNFQCVPTKSIGTNIFTCRLPPMTSGIYNLTMLIDDERIPIEETFVVTPNPSVQDVDPTVSFASGGRLVTVRGMFFSSAQSITVQFSHENWNAKLKIFPKDISSSDDGLISSFQFRTPSVPHPFLPLDVSFSLYFDETIFSIVNLIQFHYVPDVLLNVSSIPPTLPFTGEELKLHVENLTEAASISDIQLFIGCSECQLKTFTSKGITCQPPTQLLTNTAIVLNRNQQEDCSIYNSTIGPIRFRIGYREYLIGYLSYSRSLTSKYSLLTIISLIFTSGLLTIALITLVLCLFIRFRKSQTSTPTFSMKTTRELTDKPLWTTESSASTGPYYQVYEQISCSSSHENTLTRAPLLLCPHYQDKQRHYTPMPIVEQICLNSIFLTSLSIEENQLKKFFFNEIPRRFSSNQRRAMEFFYDLLNMKPFAQAFIDQLIVDDSAELLQSYAFLFRFNSSHYQSFPMTREISFFRFISTLFEQNKNDLVVFFQIFDDFLRVLIDFLDSSPTDEILQRSINSISSSTLLLYPLQYRSLQLTIDYENFLRFHLSVFDCDSIDQIKMKILRFFNSQEKTSRLIEENQLELLLPPSTNVVSSPKQIPMIKNYLFNSTIRCQKKISRKISNENFRFHLCYENELIDDENLIENKIKENFQRLKPILVYFYQQIANGLDLFSQWANENFSTNDKTKLRFQIYIRLVSDFIRRLNRLMFFRENCPIIQSSLDVIAEGLEFLFETKDEFSSQIELLFDEEKQQFAKFDSTQLHFSPTIRPKSSLTQLDIRSLILADEMSIECLMKLYQFYEIFSEPINQHIGENHVSVLLPVHHLLVQIRQCLKSESIGHDPMLI